MMSDADIRVLADDIKANGLAEPVVFHGGVLLDGRNRVKACSLVGVEARVQLWDGKGDPTNWIISKNLHRRHMSESQRAMVASELKRLIFAPAAKERQLEHLKRGDDTPLASIGANGATTLGKAAKQAAELLNVSVGSVERAGRVYKRGIPELQKAVADGSISLGAADLLSKLPEDEQAELVGDPKQAKARSRELFNSVRGKRVGEEDVPSEIPHKIMSRKGLKPAPDPLFALTSLANDVADTWERETESDVLTTRWERASAMQRETFMRSLDTLIASTRRIKKGLNKDAQRNES